MDEVLTHSNAPPPDDPPTEEESQHYETIFVRGLDDDTLYIDDLLTGFTTMYKHRVSDTFLELAIKYMTWSNHNIELDQEILNDLVRTATNDDIDLRRLYAFWMLRCHGKITNDIRCYVTLNTVHRLCIQWAVERRERKNSLLWKDPESRPGYLTRIINQNDLVDQIHEFLFHPDRVKRLTYNHIRQMIDPACEN